MTSTLLPTSVARFESLLASVPILRRDVLDAYAEREGQDPRPAWQAVLEFLKQADRPGDDLVVVEELIKRGPNSTDDVTDTLAVLDRAAFDLHEGLHHAVAPDEEVGPAHRALRAELLVSLLRGTTASREQHLQQVRDYIYENPGLFLRELYRRMNAQGLTFYSYATLCAYVEELAQSGEIITIGRHQGVPRYCFPHPDKVNRAAYFGRDFAVKGQINAELTDQFELTSAFVKVFLVNHMMRPVAMVTPVAAALSESENVEGFGKMQGPDFLESRLHLHHVGTLPRAFTEVVVVRNLRKADTDTEIPIPEAFARLATP